MNLIRKLIFLLVCCVLWTANAAEPKTVTLRQGQGGQRVLSQHGSTFGFFMPETAGYLYTGLMVGQQGVWLHKAANVKVSGANRGWVLTIEDPLLKQGKLTMTVMPLTASNGLILAVQGQRLPTDLRFIWAYGGCSAATDSLDKQAFFRPEQCLYNVFSREINAFTVYYGPSMRLKVMMGVAPPETELRLADARQLDTPQAFWSSGKKTDAPALAGSNSLQSGVTYYYCLYRQNQEADFNYEHLPALFQRESTSTQSNRHDQAQPHTSFGPDFHF